LVEVIIGKKAPAAGAAKKTKADALVFQAEGDGPRTHVLIVGVGHYPHFRDGGPDADDAASLGQLVSSTVSARILARWFVEEYSYPPAPLGSLALLLSESNPEPFETPSGKWRVSKATYEAFENAAKAWHERGNSGEGNRLIFLFCGHGFGYGVLTSLLFADFDFREQNAWDSALDLGKFVAGMETCAGAEQVFFIDACRRPHGDLLPPGAAIGRSPIHAKALPRKNFSTTRNAPLIFSTGDEQPARGRIDGASVFTDAFMKSVNGMAARDDNGDWRVNNYSLLEAMSHVSLRLTEQHFPEPQQPQGGQARAFDFHYLAKDPISPIYLDRNGFACGPGELHYEVSGAAVMRPCNEDEYELELSLPYGGYTFTLKDGQAVIAHAKQRAAPTYKKARLV
jgi:Caspase domain